MLLLATRKVTSSLEEVEKLNIKMWTRLLLWLLLYQVEQVFKQYKMLQMVSWLWINFPKKYFRFAFLDSKHKLRNYNQMVKYLNVLE